ncbi:MAG: hypothetical protein ACXV3D_02800 [Halobacteriota archaeon]
MRAIYLQAFIIVIMVLAVASSMCSAPQYVSPSPLPKQAVDEYTSPTPSPEAINELISSDQSKASQPSQPAAGSSSSSTVEIDAPSNNAQVVSNTSVAGTSKQVSSAQKLWLIIYDYDVDRYYPQTGPLAIQSNGSWSGTAYLGTHNTGVGERFDIIAVLADQNAHNAFEQYQASSRQANSYLGMTSLPTGITKDQVTVTKTSNLNSVSSTPTAITNHTDLRTGPELIKSAPSASSPAPPPVDAALLATVSSLGVGAGLVIVLAIMLRRKRER